MSSIELVFYQTSEGQIPFQSWIRSLKNTQMQAKVLARVQRIRLGNLGDWKALTGQSPLIELRDHSGFRIYCVREGQTIMILLCAGLKSSQAKDIQKAWEYWCDYQARSV